MPYIEEEKTIKTKVIGIATKIDDNDTIGVRQVIMDEIYDDPSIVKMFYLKKNEVWVSLNNGREYYMGDIKSKYIDLIINNVTQIKYWEITGGQQIPAETYMIAGQKTTKYNSFTKKKGLNIGIKLI